MPTTVRCEPLEARRLCASVSLDPDFVFSFAAIKDKLSSHFRVYEAVPARGDRTFLLGVRKDEYDFKQGQSYGLLTVIAVTGDGKPDPSFGSNGVARTGRVIRAGADVRPARLAVDDAGRVYVADSARVIRLRRNGDTDRTFGHNGSAAFAPAGRPVQLCDLVPTDDGVLVATLRTTDNVQRFAVQRIGKTVRTVWEARHDGGRLEDVDSRLYGVTATAPDVAQFADAGGHVVLARVERNGKGDTYTDPDIGVPEPVVRTTRQDVVLTTFDAAGHGADVARRELRRPVEAYPGDVQYDTVALGTADYRYPIFGSVWMNRTGQRVVVQTDQEMLRFNLAAGTARRATPPGNYAATSSGPYRDSDFYLLGDGGLGVVTGAYDSKDRALTRIDRYRPDGTHDRAYHGELPRVYDRDYGAGHDNTIDQVFAGTSGRLYFLGTGTVAGGAEPTNLTLRRLV